MNKAALFFDVDGTLTDGKINIGANGEVFKAFDAKDGYGIAVILREKGVEPMIITGRESDIVKERCGELGIELLYQGVKDKVSVLDHVLRERNLSFDNVAYMGDDIPDLQCIKLAKVNGCPRNAVTEVKKYVKFICSRKGGDGAVREFIDWMVSQNMI